MSDELTAEEIVTAFLRGKISARLRDDLLQAEGYKLKRSVPTCPVCGFEVLDVDGVCDFEGSAAHETAQGGKTMETTREFIERLAADNGNPLQAWAQDLARDLDYDLPESE